MDLSHNTTVEEKSQWNKSYFIRKTLKSCCDAVKVDFVNSAKLWLLDFRGKTIPHPECVSSLSKHCRLEAFIGLQP